MGAIKSGNNIYVQGVGNTLASVCADINDPAWIEENPADTYTVKQRYLVIDTDGELTIGNPADYSFQEILKFQDTANNQCRLNILPDGKIMIYGNVQLWASDDKSHYQSWYWQGGAYIRGNATFKPQFRCVYNWFKYRYRTGSQAEIDANEIDADYFEIIEPYNSSNRGFQWYYNFHIGTNSKLRRCTYDGGCGIGNKWGYAIYGIATQSYESDDCSKICLEDWIITNCQMGVQIQYGLLYMKNSSISNANQWGVYMVGRASFANKIFKGQNIIPQGSQGQYFSFLDNVTFTGNITGDVHIGQGHIMLFKDCTFNHVLNNIQTNYGSKALIWSGNTFNAPDYIGLPGSMDAQAFWVNALDITVKDSGGTPIEDAFIFIKQKNGYEHYVFRTDSSGKPKTMSALEGKIILTWKEQLDADGSSMVLWSDASNSTYHDIYIFKYGYEPAHLQLAMSQDRVQTVTLDDYLAENHVRQGEGYHIDKVGTLDLPNVNDVEKGVSFDGATKTGTFKKPVVDDVRVGEGYGANDNEFVGVLDLPAVDDVEKGVQYDNLTKTGIFKKPAAGDVRSGEGYGAGDNEFTGTLDLPSINDVEEGVKFDNLSKTGIFVVPAEDKVEKDIEYGALAEFKGTAEFILSLLGDNLEGDLEADTNMEGVME